MDTQTRGNPLVIAVDASTTATKAVAFDPRGATVAVGRAPLDRSSPQPGWQEQDAEAWWRATTTALRDLAASIDVANVRALCITHQRETFVCLDEAGEPLRPAILWLDTRAADQIRRLGTATVHERSGKPPSTTPSLYKIAWLAEHEPEVMRRTATVADVHAFLVERLTGRRVTSWASADPLSVVDMRTFSYAPDLLALAGLHVDQLPELVAPGAILGLMTAAAAGATGLPAGLPIVAGAGDGQCAGIGAAVTRASLAYLNLGTGLTLGTHADEYRWSRAYRTLSSPIPGRWMLEALLASGVLSLAWFRDLVARDREPGAEERLQRLAADTPPGSGGLLFLPYLTSAETPYWDPLARGAWVGLRDDHGLGHMYRAILEGIAYEQRLVLDLIEESTGAPVALLRAMGGGSRNRLWLQILADVLGRPIAVGDQVETTALGAGVLAAAGVSLEGDADLITTAERMTGEWRPMEPSEHRAAVYEVGFEVYRQVYPALAGLFPRLSGLATADLRPPFPPGRSDANPDK